MFENLRVPLIVAPMAGGPSTPELVAAAQGAGGFGFLGGGYLSYSSLADQVDRVRGLGVEEYGVNLFVPGTESAVDTQPYLRRLRDDAARYGVRPGTPEWDDDGYPAKLRVVLRKQVPVVSFTFGAPAADDVRRLHDAGSQVVVTVTSQGEARQAAAAGADALCVQGFEAGGHRGVFADDPDSPDGGDTYGLLAALRLVSATVDLPLIAAGGLTHGADVAAVLVAGAVAAQLGTAFLRADEAGTNPVHQRALAAGGRQTELTRAFSGRPARALANRFLRQHSAQAPAAYPQVHHLTKPIRAAAGREDDPEALNLWAGQAYALAEAGPAAEIIAQLWEQARQALAAGARRAGS